MIMNMNRLTASRHLRSTIARSCAVHQRAALSSASTLSGVVATTTVAPSSTTIATHWRTTTTTTSSVGSPAWSSARAFSTTDRTPLEKDSNSLNQATPYNICFLRHGQSTWNRDNRFIGWTYTPLTEDGIVEARVAGDVLRNSGLLFDEVHTSLLRRSIRTVNICLMEMGQEYIPVHKNWRLNERSYGDLVGLNKKEVVKQYGADQVKRWRRSFDEPPPPMNVDHPYHPRLEPRYRTVSCFYPSLCLSFEQSNTPKRETEREREVDVHQSCPVVLSHLIAYSLDTTGLGSVKPDMLLVDFFKVDLVSCSRVNACRRVTQTHTHTTQRTTHTPTYMFL